ncbi:unnamed protein product [Amaranthus hypochondriacus]
MFSSERERGAGRHVLGFSKNFFRFSNLNFQNGKRRGGSRCYSYNGFSRSGLSPSQSVHGGHRGVFRHQGWSGPREHPHKGFSSKRIGVFTLFVDGICSSTSINVLRLLFKGIGVVVDVFISRKSRTSRKDRFGFVRFKYREEAERAIKELNGQRLDGGTLRISMAKYKRGGEPIKSVSRFIRWWFPPNHGPRRDKDSRPGRNVSTSSPELNKNEFPSLSSSEERTNGESASELRNNETGGIEESTVTEMVPLHTVASAPVLDGESKTVDKDKTSSTAEQITMETLGDFEKSRSCRPRTLKKIMNIKDIHNYLGYYGPTKA